MIYLIDLTSVNLTPYLVVFIKHVNNRQKWQKCTQLIRSHTQTHLKILTAKERDLARNSNKKKMKMRVLLSEKERKNKIKLRKN